MTQMPQAPKRLRNASIASGASANSPPRSLRRATAPSTARRAASVHGLEPGTAIAANLKELGYGG